MMSKIVMSLVQLEWKIVINKNNTIQKNRFQKKLAGNLTKKRLNKQNLEKIKKEGTRKRI